MGQLESLVRFLNLYVRGFSGCVEVSVLTFYSDNLSLNTAGNLIGRKRLK